MKKTIAILLTAGCLAAGAVAQTNPSIIKGRIGGAGVTDQGADTISGRVGGAAPTDAGRVPAEPGTGGSAVRPGLSGDPFSTRAGVVGGTNTLGTTTTPDRIFTR